MVKQVNELELDPLSELNPRMNSEKFNSFINEIEENGILEPISIVDDNKILDGRHRWMVAKELGISEIKCVDKSYLSQEERRAFVYSTEARRHQTPTQLAISAWNYYNSVKANGDKITMGEAAAKFGSSVAQVKRVNKIGGTGARHYKRPDIIELLFSSMKLNISSDPTKPYETDSLYTIEEYLAKQKKQLESQSKRSVQKRVIELSDEEEDKVMNAIIDLKRESAVVRDAIARRLYAYSMNQNQQ